MSESKKNPPESKEPFVPKEDRPEVKITLDTPLSELRVRELSSILGRVIGGGKHPNFEVGSGDGPQIRALNEFNVLDSDAFTMIEVGGGVESGCSFLFGVF